METAQRCCRGPRAVDSFDEFLETCVGAESPTLAAHTYRKVRFNLGSLTAGSFGTPCTKTA